MSVASKTMDKRQRLVGIDLLRGLAIYGVVILHTDQGIQLLPDAWLMIRQFAAFAVPFFLATSFYLTANKLYAGKPYRLSSRFTRLFVPYAFWSAFYLLYRFLKYLAIHELSRAIQLVHDPISIAFFGGAAFHLYFLPLLLTGTLLMKLGEWLIQKQASLRLLVTLTFISFWVYEIVLGTGNMVDISAGLAFQPFLNFIVSTGNQNQILRVLLVEFAWAIRCLPYVLFAIVLTHPKVTPYLKAWINHALPIWLLAFLIINFLGNQLLPDAVHDVSRGFTALLLALSLSDHLQENSIVQNLGFCSLGIYLIHLLFVETAQTIWVRLNPGHINQVSTLTLFAVSVVIFLVSWGAVILLLRYKPIAKVLI
ncbi:MAG: acyltransferase family protein (plasmid) [Leptolyngbya sp. BL-A-14]